MGSLLSHRAYILLVDPGLGQMWSSTARRLTQRLLWVLPSGQSRCTLKDVAMELTPWEWKGAKAMEQNMAHIRSHGRECPVSIPFLLSLSWVRAKMHGPESFAKEHANQEGHLFTYISASLLSCLQNATIEDACLYSFPVPRQDELSQSHHSTNWTSHMSYLTFLRGQELKQNWQH